MTIEINEIDFIESIKNSLKNAKTVDEWNDIRKHLINEHELDTLFVIKHIDTSGLITEVLGKDYNKRNNNANKNYKAEEVLSILREKEEESV